MKSWPWKVIITTKTNDDAEISDIEYDLHSNTSTDNAAEDGDDATEDQIQINIEINDNHNEMTIPTHIGTHFKPQRRGGSFNPPSKTKTKINTHSHKYGMDGYLETSQPQDHTMKIGRVRSNSDPRMSPTQTQLQQMNPYEHLYYILIN